MHSSAYGAGATEGGGYGIVEPSMVVEKPSKHQGVSTTIDDKMVEPAMKFNQLKHHWLFFSTIKSPRIHEV